MRWCEQAARAAQYGATAAAAAERQAAARVAPLHTRIAARTAARADRRAQRPPPRAAQVSGFQVRFSPWGSPRVKVRQGKWKLD